MSLSRKDPISCCAAISRVCVNDDLAHVASMGLQRGRSTLRSSSIRFRGRQSSPRPPDCGNGGGLSRPNDPGLPSLGGGDTPLNVAGGVARETTTFYLPPTRPHLRHRRRCRRRCCCCCCCCCFPMSSSGVNLAGTLGFAGPAPHGFAEAKGGARRGSTPLHREVWLDLCPSPEMGFIT